MNKPEIICQSCGKMDAWEGEEEVWRVTGQEGHKPELMLLLACSCGATYTFAVKEE